MLIADLDTVAGDAKFRSETSKSIRIQEDRCTISPLIRHSFLESSSTVFKFSENVNNQFDIFMEVHMTGWQMSDVTDDMCESSVTNIYCVFKSF